MHINFCDGMWRALRTKFVHARLAYGRGRSYLDITGGFIGGIVATGNWHLALPVLIAAVIFYTSVGHIDRKYLRVWQEENRQGSEINPFMLEMMENVREIRSLILRRDTDK